MKRAFVLLLLFLFLALAGCGGGQSGTAQPAGAPAAAATPVAQGEPAAAGPFVWQSDEAAARADAARQGKRLLVEFAAEWCGPCKEMQRVTFADAAVDRELAQNYIGLRFDVTAQSDADAALQKRFGAERLPTMLVLAPGGEELLRLSEFVAPEPFLARLRALPGGK